MNYPYRSQWATDASTHRNDCGPACLAMVMSAFGLSTTIDKISSLLMGAKDIGTDQRPLADFLTANGIKATVWSGLGNPPVPSICLVKYSGFERKNVQDRNFTGWHWLLLLENSTTGVTVHDPDWWAPTEQGGANKHYSVKEWANAFIPYQGTKLAITWQEAVLTVFPMTGTVTSDADFLRVRDGVNSPKVLRYLDQGAKVKILDQAMDTYSEGPRLWYKIEMSFSNPKIYADELKTKVYNSTEIGWVAGWLVTPDRTIPPPVVTPPVVVVTPPTPPVVTPPLQKTTKPKISVNILANGQKADLAVAQGMKHLHVSFNDGLAVRIKRDNPGMSVSHRALFYDGHLPSVSEFKDKHGYALTCEGMDIFGVNEGEQIGYGAEEIMKRAQWDRQMWKLCKDNGTNFVGAGFGMGCPNIVVPEIRDALRKWYAPLFNEGMDFNQHLYAGNDHSGIPIKQEIYNTNTQQITWDGKTVVVPQTWWLSQRTRMYVAFCEFDGSKAKFKCDEMGVDNPGPFSDFGYTDEEIADFLLKFQSLHSEPMPDGGEYHLDFGAVFQSGDPGRWRAFEISGAYPTLKARGVFD